MLKQIKTNSKKCGPGSEYRLYLRFHPYSGGSRKDFNYLSDDRKGAKKGLDNLVRRVLNRSAKGKFELALLYHNKTNELLKVWLPNHGQMTAFEYLEFRKERYRRRNSLLRAYMILGAPLSTRIIEAGLKYPVVIHSTDFNQQTGEYGLHQGLFSLQKAILETEYEPYLVKAYIYLEKDNDLVGYFTRKGFHFSSDDFKTKILNQDSVLKIILSPV